MTTPKLIVRGAAGNVILDVGDRVLKFLGFVDIGTLYTGSTNSGTVTDANFALSGVTPWWALDNLGFNADGADPTVSVSGSTLTWTFPVPATARPNTRVRYGIY